LACKPFSFWLRSIAQARSKGSGRIAPSHHSIAVVDTKPQPPGVDEHAQLTILRQIPDPDDRRRKPRRSGNAKRPARAESIGDPTDNRRT
jgi:hypothetical protein